MVRHWTICHGLILRFRHWTQYHTINSRCLTMLRWETYVLEVVASGWTGPAKNDCICMNRFNFEQVVWDKQYQVSDHLTLETIAFHLHKMKNHMENSFSLLYLNWETLDIKWTNKYLNWFGLPGSINLNWKSFFRLFGLDISIFESSSGEYIILDWMEWPDQLKSCKTNPGRNSLTMEEVLKINNDDGSYNVKHRNVHYCI